MNKAKLLAGVLVLFISIPIWLFLLHTILKQLEVDRLIWFLFWIYVPLQFLIGIISGIVEVMVEWLQQKLTLDLH